MTGFGFSALSGLIAFDLIGFDLSALVDRLAGPVGLKLSLALVHFLWQGVLIAAGAALLMRVLGRRSAGRRYAIGVAGLALMAVAPVVTFCLVAPPPPVRLTNEAVSFDAEELGALLADLEGSLGAAGDSEPAVPPLTWPERLRLWQPYLLLVWLAGTGVFALRLGVGAQASWRFGRKKRPLPEAWLKIAVEVASRVGIKAPRVFLSDRVAEAVALGLLRPMVLIPAAWLGRIPPEVLEAVLAHELAHLRRYDLWVNLLQRCVEAALFYHPAVWWLSRRVRVEREYCCDEAAALAVSGRAAYARALEFVAAEAVLLRRAAAARPAIFGTALAAGMGGDSMALLDRVRRVLGAEDKPPRGRLSEGLIALAVPAALWAGVAAVGPAFARADEAKENAAKEEKREEAKDEAAAGDEAKRDVLFFRDADGDDRDVILFRDENGDVLRDGADLGPEPVRVPLLGEVPLVGRLFEQPAIAEADGAAEIQDVLIERARPSDGDVSEAIRELREELRALREEVKELRSGKPSGADSAPEPKRSETRSYRKDVQYRVIEGKPPRIVTYGIGDDGKPREVKSEPFEGALPKSPALAGELRLEARQHDGMGDRLILRKADEDGKGPQRFEVRVFKDGRLKEGDPPPEELIKGFEVETSNGQPRVFLYREGRGGKTERVEGKVNNGEGVVEFDDGRIHVRPLEVEPPRGKPAPPKGPMPPALPKGPMPPAPPGDAAKVRRISRHVVALEIDGRKVPVVVEERRDGEDGSAREISVRVLEKAPPGADVRPNPEPKGGDPRDKVIRDLEDRVKELQKRLEEKAEAERQRAEAAAREAEAQRQAQAATDAELKPLIEKFNELVKQRSYAEAVQVAKQAKEIDPEDPVTVTMLYKAKVLYEQGQAEKAHQQEAKAPGGAARAEVEKAEAEKARVEEELRRLQSLDARQRSEAQLEAARAAVETLKIDAAALREAAKAGAEKAEKESDDADRPADGESSGEAPREDDSQSSDAKDENLSESSDATGWAVGWLRDAGQPFGFYFGLAR